MTILCVCVYIPYMMLCNIYNIIRIYFIHTYTHKPNMYLVFIPYPIHTYIRNISAHSFTICSAHLSLTEAYDGPDMWLVTAIRTEEDSPSPGHPPPPMQRTVSADTCPWWRALPAPFSVVSSDPSRALGTQQYSESTYWVSVGNHHPGLTVCGSEYSTVGGNLPTRSPREATCLGDSPHRLQVMPRTLETFSWGRSLHRKPRLS